MSGRTIAIGDIHGDLAALDRLLARLPELDAQDTLVFIGDYVDRGPDSKGVVERVREVQRRWRAKVVCLRGNHEDKWIHCYEKADPTFMLPAGNGCTRTYRSYAGGPPLAPDESLDTAEYPRFFDVKSWMPADVLYWLEDLALWYEDDHAIYVHAGLEGEGHVWLHPSQSNPRNLLWCREPDFFANYAGKRLCFGHTQVKDLPKLQPKQPASLPAQLLDRVLHRHESIWLHGDLIGLDTGCGKGGHLSAIELPSGHVFDGKP